MSDKSFLTWVFMALKPSGRPPREEIYVAWNKEKREIELIRAKLLWGWTFPIQLLISTLFDDQKEKAVIQLFKRHSNFAIVSSADLWLHGNDAGFPERIEGGILRSSLGNAYLDNFWLSLWILTLLLWMSNEQEGFLDIPRLENGQQSSKIETYKSKSTS